MQSSKEALYYWVQEMRVIGRDVAQLRSANAATCLHNQQDDENDGEVCQVMPVGVVMGAIVLGSRLQTVWVLLLVVRCCIWAATSAWQLCLLTIRSPHMYQGLVKVG